jgi:hypothetical protein
MEGLWQIVSNVEINSGMGEERWRSGAQSGGQFQLHAVVPLFYL